MTPRFAFPLAIPFPIHAVLAYALVACNDAPPGPAPCLGSISPTQSTIAAGASLALAVAYANPDRGNTSVVVVAWSTTGGGTFDKAETSLDLKPIDDPYGNPAGITGSVSNTFHATGPSGTYGVHASVLPGAGCIAAAYDATITVTGNLPDGGTGDAAADAMDAANAPDAASSADGATD